MNTDKNKETTIFDYFRRRNEIRASFPDDLLNDLEDDEPALFAEAQECDQRIAQYKMHLESSVAPIALLPSIVTEGWDRPKKKKSDINWSDMENLLKLYALGLYFKDQPRTYQADYDQEELENVVQRASVSSRRKKGVAAQQRLDKATTYLRFGMKTLDAFFLPTSSAKEYTMRDLDAEICDTENEYNAAKLRKSKNMAMGVGRFICQRYNNLGKE